MRSFLDKLLLPILGLVAITFLTVPIATPRTAHSTSVRARVQPVRWAAPASRILLAAET
jgi:hypothetical protein